VNNLVNTQSLRSVFCLNPSLHDDGSIFSLFKRDCANLGAKSAMSSLTPTRTSPRSPHGTEALAAEVPPQPDDVGASSAEETLASPDSQTEDENDAVCDVCGDDTSWEDCPIILCDGCDVAVHSLCYGIKVKGLYELEQRESHTSLPIISQLP